MPLPTIKHVLAAAARLNVSKLDKPGFGVELNPEVALQRPYPS